MPKVDPLRDFDRLPDSAVVRMQVAYTILGVSETMGWRLVQAGELKKVQITERTAGIVVGSIRMRQRKQASSPSSIRSPRPQGPPQGPTSVDFDDDLIEPAEAGREYGAVVAKGRGGDEDD